MGHGALAYYRSCFQNTKWINRLVGFLEIMYSQNLIRELILLGCSIKVPGKEQ